MMEYVNLVFQFVDVMDVAYIISGIAGLVLMRDWNKLKGFVFSESLKLVNDTLSNQEKRDLVARLASEAMPKKLKPFVTKEMLKNLVDYVYVTRVKPENDRNK